MEEKESTVTPKGKEEETEPGNKPSSTILGSVKKCNPKNEESSSYRCLLGAGFGPRPAPAAARQRPTREPLPALE